jgi:predicted small lipoprotein YifL
MSRFVAFALTGLVAVSLLACGQRGPLTVPPKPPPGYVPPEQRPATPPAPTREDEKASQKS